MRRERCLDRIGQMIIEPGLHLADEFAEAEYHADLVWLDAEKSREGPQDDRRQREQRNSAAAEIARQETAQHALAAAEKFLKIGRLRSRTPRAAGLIAQRHMLLLAAGRMTGMAAAFGSRIYRLHRGAGL